MQHNAICFIDCRNESGEWMMKAALRNMLAVSICSGAAMSICPEGGVKQVIQLLCTTILLLSILNTVSGFDYSSFALEKAKLSQTEQELMDTGKQANERLNRRVIEEAYRSFILTQAASIGMSDLKADVEVEWNMDGLWIPVAVKLYGTADENTRLILTEVIREELGIPSERQVWSGDG